MHGYASTTLFFHYTLNLEVKLTKIVTGGVSWILRSSYTKDQIKEKDKIYIIIVATVQVSFLPMLIYFSTLQRKIPFLWKIWISSPVFSVKILFYFLIHANLMGYSEKPEKSYGNGSF